MCRCVLDRVYVCIGIQCRCCVSGTNRGVINGYVHKVNFRKRGKVGKVRGGGNF